MISPDTLNYDWSSKRGWICLDPGTGRVLKAGTVLLDEADNVLLIAKVAGNGQTVPKGHLEFDEQLENCAERETLEETGMQARCERYLGTVAIDKPPMPNLPPQAALIHFFLGRVDGTMPTPQYVAEDRGPHWYPGEVAVQLVVPEYRGIIRQALLPEEAVPDLSPSDAIEGRLTLANATGPAAP